MAWKSWTEEVTKLSTGEELEIVNVAPMFGPRHVGHPDCWCHPEMEEDILVHQVMH